MAGHARDELQSTRRHNDAVQGGMMVWERGSHDESMNECANPSSWHSITLQYLHPTMGMLRECLSIL